MRCNPSSPEIGVTLRFPPLAVAMSFGIAMWLVARALPERSDLRSREVRTGWRAEGDRTRVTYEAEFTPDFWVPAVISRNYAGRMLRKSVLELFENVEERAREH
jgi:hypothetical protein